jgi:hypothetical protein
MQFTPQQLAGGQKYTATCRIGNWYEELALEESKLQNFEKRAASGSLSLRKQQLKLSLCNELVPLSYSPDGVIRFGDTIILQHDLSGALLACDPFREYITGQEKYFISGSPDNGQPRARNTFRVLRPPAHFMGLEDDPEDPILRVGQAFCLGCNESLLVNPQSNILSPTLFLGSTKKNERNATKQTNRQMVFLTPKNDADSVWLAIIPSRGHKNAAQRFLAKGQPVTIQDVLQITHRQTNMYLACDPASKETTEFGTEIECFADRTALSGKLYLVSSEFKGLSTSQTLEKPDSPNYSWHFVTSADERAAADTRVLPPPATDEVLAAGLREYIVSRGIDGFWDLRAFFESLNQRTPTRKGKFDREDLKEALLGWGCPYDAKFLEKLLVNFDKRNLSLLDANDFISFIRGPIPENRRVILENVFRTLDINREGRLSAEYLAGRFNGADHPLVSMRGLADQEAFDHFLTFNNFGRAPSSVGVEAFVDYYSDLSAGIDDDSYFEAIVRSNWP